MSEPAPDALSQRAQAMLASIANDAAHDIEGWRDVHALIRDLEADRQRLRAALTQVELCEARFALDPLEHARNAVEHCRVVTRAALAAHLAPK